MISRPVRDLTEDHVYRLPRAHRFRRDAGDRGHQARPLGQLDDGEDVRDRVGERVVRGVPDDRVRVNRAVAAHLPPAGIRRVAVRAGGVARGDVAFVRIGECALQCRKQSPVVDRPVVGGEDTTPDVGGQQRL